MWVISKKVMDLFLMSFLLLHKSFFVNTRVEIDVLFLFQTLCITCICLHAREILTQKKCFRQGSILRLRLRKKQQFQLRKEIY